MLEYGQLKDYPNYLVDKLGHVITKAKLVFVRPKRNKPHYRFMREKNVRVFLDDDGDEAVRIRNKDGKYETVKVSALVELAGK